VLPERAARLLGRRTGPGPRLVLFPLAAQLAPHLELDDLCRPLSDRTGNGIEMPGHQLAPL